MASQCAHEIKIRYGQTPVRGDVWLSAKYITMHTQEILFILFNLPTLLKL